ncbi:MAG: ribosome small subunit-dependent GTPase A [Litoreibacter sp.]
MSRDYSQFMPTSDSVDKKLSGLAVFGWQPFFEQQTDVDEMAITPPMRVTQVHRSGLTVIGEEGVAFIPPGPEATVGDWVLHNSVLPTSSRVLDRKSLIKRRAAGHDRSTQLIAANLDTAFIVTSCNLDFNVARLERYVALVLEADVTPVILLTKPDICDAPEAYVDAAREVSDLVPVVVLDARGEEPLTKLTEWCQPRKTVAFLGSSGVGKSTLANALSKSQDIATRAIREDDARGRHTTTHRHLHFVPGGYAVLDTPGMRELQLTEATAGVDELFADLVDLATRCKFRNCAHETEPGCAIKAALAAGEIDESRFVRWRKLVLEGDDRSDKLAQRKPRDKPVHKSVK